MSSRQSLLILLAVLCAAPATSAVEMAAEVITVVDPYVRRLPPGQEQTAAYFALHNAGRREHALVKVSSPAARTVELHTTVKDNGMMKMRPVPKIEIPPGGAVRLEPGGYHIMLIGLRQPLQEQARVPLTLGFEDGSEKTITAAVRAAPTAGKMDSLSHHH